VREPLNVAELATLLPAGTLITASDLPLEFMATARPNVAVSSADPRMDAADPLAIGMKDATAAGLRQTLSQVPFAEARDAVLARFERAYLEDLLRDCRGHLNDAAKLSGMNARTLYEKMQKFGLSKEQFRPR